MKITKKHIEALASSIRSVKRAKKPLEANRDYYLYRTRRLAREVEEDKMEGMNGPVLDKIGSLEEAKSPGETQVQSHFELKAKRTSRDSPPRTTTSKST